MFQSMLTFLEIIRLAAKFKQTIVGFFKNVLELVLGWIEFDELALLKVLIEILDEDAKFYYARDATEAYRYSHTVSFFYESFIF